MEFLWKMTFKPYIVALLSILVCAVTATPQATTTGTTSAKVEVAVLDQSHLNVLGAQVEIRAAGSVVATTTTDENGHAVFAQLASGRYTISASKEGFETAIKSDLEYQAGASVSVELTLYAAVTKQTMDVSDTSSSVEVTTESPTSVGGELAKEMPSRPATVSDALPLIPGVARKPGGGLQLSGSGEHRSAMIVNSADVTDPATGEFGLTVPIDIVEKLDYYQSSFLAEYGRFTAGFVSVETKRGGERWKWELNDPFPEFIIHSWGLRGLRTATPRLNAEGPLIPGKLYFSEGFEYVMRKELVNTLPFPFNEKRTQGVNSFAQFDWVMSDKNLVTATMHVAPQRLGNVNLSYYNPGPTTPDASTHNYTGTISDKWSILGGLWDNTLGITRFDANVWAKGTLNYVFQPQVESGNYFSQQRRDAERYSWSSSFAFQQWNHFGSHNFKAGTYFSRSFDNGQLLQRPVDIEDASGRLLERMAFTGGAPFNYSDTEVGLFEQDHWVLGPRVSIDLGLRMERQEMSHATRLAPRAGIAWNLFARLGTVLRAGGGVFYDRVPLGVYSFESYPERVLTYYDASGAVRAGPFTYVNALGGVRSRKNFVLAGNESGNFSPSATTGMIQIEQPVGRSVRLRAGFLQTASSDLVTLNETTPDPVTKQAFTLLSGDGSAHYRQLEVSARVRVDAKRELFFSYVHSRATGDLNEFAAYIGSFPNTLTRPNQVATLSTDLPNRFLAWGRLQLPHGFGLAPVFEYRSGFPYSNLNELQLYAGVPNSSRFPHFLSADARLWRDFKVSPKYTLRFSVSSFNLTNHFNPESTHWNTADSAHGLFFGERHRRFTADFDVIF